MTQQGGEPTSWVWLNGEFHTKPWTQTVPGAIQSPPDLIEDEVSDPESALSDSEAGNIVPWLLILWDRQFTRCRRWLPGSEVLYLFFQWSRQPNVPTLGHAMRGVRLSCNGMH